MESPFAWIIVALIVVAWTANVVRAVKRTAAGVRTEAPVQPRVAAATAAPSVAAQAVPPAPRTVRAAPPAAELLDATAPQRARAAPLFADAAAAQRAVIMAEVLGAPRGLG